MLTLSMPLPFSRTSMHSTLNPASSNLWVYHGFLPALRHTACPPTLSTRRISRISKSSSDRRCSYAASGEVSSVSRAVLPAGGSGVDGGIGSNPCRLVSLAAWDNEVDLQSIESMTMTLVRLSSGRPRSTLFDK